MADYGPLEELKFRLAGVLGSFFVRALAATCDGELENRHIPDLVPVFTHRGRGIGILISQSQDGEYVARAADRLGFHVIRGSSTRGAAEGFRLLLCELEAGRDVAITPDGPTGPPYKVKKGIVYLARVSGAAIVPTGIAVDRYKQFASWDEFRLMLPGAYVLARFGEPVYVPEHSNKHEMEQIRRDLERRLNDLTADCEARVEEARRTRHLRARWQCEPRPGVRGARAAQ